MAPAPLQLGDQLGEVVDASLLKEQAHEDHGLAVEVVHLLHPLGVLRHGAHGRDVSVGGHPVPDAGQAEVEEVEVLRELGDALMEPQGCVLVLSVLVGPEGLEHHEVGDLVADGVRHPYIAEVSPHEHGVPGPR